MRPQATEQFIFWEGVWGGRNPPLTGEFTEAENEDGEESQKEEECEQICFLDEDLLVGAHVGRRRGQRSIPREVGGDQRVRSWFTSLECISAEQNV